MIQDSYMMFGPIDRKNDTLDQTLTTGLARYAEKYGRPVTEALVNPGVVGSLTPVEGLTITPNLTVPPTEVWLIGRTAAMIIPVEANKIL
jgi:hypothetical protein